MEAQIALLKSWIKSGNLKPSGGLSHRQLTTFIGELETMILSEGKIVFSDDQASFIQVIHELDQYAIQPWTDKNMWMIYGGNGNRCGVQIKLFRKMAHISIQGFGASLPIIAKTPLELKEAVMILWRHR